MGAALDEFPVYARPHDRHFGQRPHRRHHGRQPRHDRGEVPASPVRGRHGALQHDGAVQARVPLAPRHGHRRIRPPRLQSGRQAGGAVPAAGLDADATALMRSLLFVPADGGKKLHKALGCGADAVIVDLEDSIAPDRKAAARATAAAFVQEAAGRWARPFICVRVNGLATGLIDDDLDAIVPARPDAIMLPKAEGGAAIVHADAKLAAREAIGGLPRGHIKIIAMAIENAAGLFLASTVRRQSARLIGLSWGAEDLAAELGAESNRDGDGRYTSPYRLARTLSLIAA